MFYRSVIIIKINLILSVLSLLVACSLNDCAADLDNMKISDQLEIS